MAFMPCAIPSGPLGGSRKARTNPYRPTLDANQVNVNVNVNGAINIQDLRIETRMDDRINANSTIELLKRIEQSNPKAGVMTVICDNARYYRSKLVKKYLMDSKIALIFLPPYSPNLNLIERFWKFFKKKVLYRQYYKHIKSSERLAKSCSNKPNAITKHSDRC